MDSQTSDSTVRFCIDVKFSGTTARGIAHGKLISGFLDDRTSESELVWIEVSPQTKKRMSQALDRTSDVYEDS